MTPSRAHKRKGTTLLEALVAATTTVMVLGTVTSVWVAAAAGWYRGSGKIQAETLSRKAVRTISGELAEAMTVTVDGDGMGLTFEQPAKDQNGDYQTDVMGQPVSDGFQRRIYYQSGKIVYKTPKGNRLLADHVVTTDPLSLDGKTPYKVFTPGPGKITRQVTVMVATCTTGVKQEKVSGRNRETVFLRNIYDTTR